MPKNRKRKGKSKRSSQTATKLPSADILLATRQKHADRYDDLCKEIDTLVQKCCSIVSRVNPLSLLVRSSIVFMMHAMDSPAEESLQGSERIASYNMLEYVQKIICGSGSGDGKNDISDEEFNELSTAVGEIYGKLQLEYFLCRSGKLSQREDYDSKFDEYAVLNEMNWLSVRGYRYQCQEAEYFSKVLSPQSDLLEEYYGIKSDDIADGVEKLTLSLSTGLPQVASELEEFKNESLAAIEADPKLSYLPPPEAMESVVKRNGWEERRDSIFGRFLGADLFDVKLVTDWPDAFIKDLSLKPGEDIDFSKEGSMPSWPTKFSKTSFKPFISIDGTSYCFHQNMLTDSFYRALEHAIRSKKLSNTEAWAKRQKAASESYTSELFARLLPNAQKYSDTYYDCLNARTGQRERAECDLLIVFDRQLLVIEVKAGRYTHKSPNRNLKDHLDSVKKLIEKAAVQCNRFTDALDDAGSLDIFDGKGHVITTLERNSFDEIFRCCVSLDQIDDVAPRSEDLAKLGIEIGPNPIWTLSINDLLVIADVFDNPLIFIDYLGERLRAFSSPHCRVHDELDHLGLYLVHNRYVMLSEEQEPNSHIIWDGYRDVFDRYYSDKLAGLTTDLPKQEMPLQLKQILDLLSQSRRESRARVAQFLLGMNSSTREEICKQIIQIQETQKQQKRPRPISSHGDVRLTVVISQRGPCMTNIEDFFLHAASIISLQEENDRLLLLLQYSDYGLLEDIRWRFLDQSSLDSIDPGVLQESVRKLRKNRSNLNPKDMFGSPPKY